MNDISWNFLNWYLHAKCTCFEELLVCWNMTSSTNYKLWSIFYFDKSQEIHLCLQEAPRVGQKGFYILKIMNTVKVIVFQSIWLYNRYHLCSKKQFPHEKNCYFFCFNFSLLVLLVKIFRKNNKLFKTKDKFVYMRFFLRISMSYARTTSGFSRSRALDPSFM